MNQHQRIILETTVSNFEKFVQPLLPSFSQGILHNDINVKNIVQNEEEQCTFGIIDFSDCIHNCHLFELAIAVHGYVTHTSIADMDQAVYATAPLVAGYMRAFPLSSDELDCLYYTVLARTCVIAVATEKNRQDDPTNGYLSELVRQSWRAAEVFYKHPKQEMDKIWIDAIKKPKDYFLPA
jgi:Ser/Thr protein kinase RdoA (MazF antagonist)